MMRLDECRRYETAGPLFPDKLWAGSKKLISLILALVTLAGCGLSHPDLHLGPRSTAFYDDFTTKPDGPLKSGAVSDSGQSYTVLGQIPWEIKNGRLTHTQTSTATAQSSYLGVNLGVRVGFIWAEYEVPAGPEPQESIVLVDSADEFTTPGYEFSNAAAHCTFTYHSFRYDSLQALHPGLKNNVLGRGTYRALVPGTYRIEISLTNNVASILAPDGRRWTSASDDTIDEWAGPWATLQLYSQAAGTTLTQLRVLRWGAETHR